MFCHAAPRKCHVLSCDVMIRMRGPRVQWPVRAWRCGAGRGPGIPSGLPGFASSASVCPLDPSSFRSLRRRFVPGGGTLFRAYRARAGPRVAAGAVRAPDCARARARTQGALVPSVSQRFFRAGANREKNGSADAASFLPLHIGRGRPMSSPMYDFFLIYRTKAIFVAAAARRSRVFRREWARRRLCRGATRRGNRCPIPWPTW